MPASCPSLILLVDDDGALRQMLATWLQLLGQEPRPVAGGREALEFLRRHHRDVAAVLLDVRMPELDGPQTLSALRGVRSDLPCRFMTGYCGEHGCRHLESLSGGPVLQKPFRLAELAASVAELVGHPPSGPVAAPGEARPLAHA